MYKIIWIISILFILLNTFSINAFYNNFLWKDKYQNKLYDDSIKYFDKSGNINWAYNKANTYYKEKKYLDSIKEYKSILSDKKNDLNFRINHNIANAFYRLWEQSKDKKIKLKSWEKSIKYYTDALNIKYDEKTKKNLEFVLKKIKQEKKKQQENQQKENNSNKQENSKDSNQSSKWENKDWNSQEKWDKNWKSQNKKDSKNWKSWEKWDTNKNNKDWKTWSWKDANKKSQEKWNKDWKSWKTKEWADWKSDKAKWDKQAWKTLKSQENNISDKQEAAIQKYEQSLKQDQLQNAWNFNKVYEENTSNDPFDNFFNDPFFNNDLLNNWWNDKKDW